MILFLLLIDAQNFFRLVLIGISLPSGEAKDLSDTKDNYKIHNFIDLYIVH